MKEFIIKQTKAYYNLTKPERTLTNVITAAAGYLLASKWHIQGQSFLAILIGSYLIIASACVWNNLLDRKLDQKMARTKKRALSSGQISVTNAVIFASLVGIAGFVILTYTNWLTFSIGVAAFLSYVVLYGYAKRHTMHSTLIGTAPGAASLVAGYTAYTGHLDKAAFLLFLIMLAWQMTHFYAIAIYRYEDYKAANLPIISVIKGVRATKNWIFFYFAVFVISACLLTIFGYTGYIYLIGVVAMSLLWLRKIISKPSNPDMQAWARAVFLFSLIVIVTLSGLLSVGSVLP